MKVKLNKLKPARTVAELEEEKYVDPFLQSTNELTPVTLPINPRIDSKSKLSVSRDLLFFCLMICFFSK